MARPAIVHTRREFLRSASLTAGAVAALSFPAPAVAQRQKLIYWCYQFLKESDDARANFAREWAKKNNVDLQISMVPLKEFLPKITAAIEARATPDIVESNLVELRGRGQVLDITDLYRKIEKTYGGWVGNAPKFMLEPDGRVHHIVYGFQGFMLISRADLLKEAGFTSAPATWVEFLEQAKKAQKLPRVYGLGIPLSNQTDSQVWEDMMRSYGARLADNQGKRVVLGDHKKEVWEFLDYFTEVWKSGVLPPGVTTWDNTMNNSTYQSGKAVFVLNPITISLWLEANNPELLAKTAHYTFPRGPKAQIQPLTFGSRGVLKYTKVPELAKQFMWDSMDLAKMDREYSVSQWGPPLNAYMGFEVWKSGVLPPGVTTWDNTMNNSTYQSGKAVFVLNPITISLWLEANNPELLAKTAHYTFPRGPKAQIQPLTFGSRGILKYTKAPELAKQFMWDSMDLAKMDREYSVSQWGPPLNAYMGFEVWKKKPFMKGLIEMSLRGEPQGYPDVFNDAWREQFTNTTISRMLQRLVVDNWSRDKAFAEAIDVLNRIYAKYV